jgi:hypothetical protein
MYEDNSYGDDCWGITHESIVKAVDGGRGNGAKYLDCTVGHEHGGDNVYGQQ